MKAFFCLNQKSKIISLLLVFYLFFSIYSVGEALSDNLPIPDSEVAYLGASATSAFVVIDPYVINIQEIPSPIQLLLNSSYTNDFGGNIPFVNADTGTANPAQMQAWDPVFAVTFNPPLRGSYSLTNFRINNLGFLGRVEKSLFQGEPVTMVRYNAGDNMTTKHPRSSLNSFPIPPRTHARWDLEVAFGQNDGINNWELTQNGVSPVLFWQVHSRNHLNPPLSALVDTDPKDPTMLQIRFAKTTGEAASPTIIGTVNGIPPSTMVPITIEAFLDERLEANGGKGILRITVNNQLVVEETGPTLADGTTPHWWAMCMYLYNEFSPYQYTRASFWKTARMLVFPNPTGTDIAPPTSPCGLTAVAADSNTVNLTWNDSKDTSGVAGYQIFRDGVLIDTSAVSNYTDKTVIEGVSYLYTVCALDATGKVSAQSKTVWIKPPIRPVTITSYNVTQLSSDTATIYWTTNIPTRSIVNFGGTHSRSDSQTDNSDLLTDHSMTFTGLQSNTNYYYTINADSGYAIDKAWGNFRTLPPSVMALIPTGLTAVAADSNTVKLDWNDSSDPSGVVVGYTIYRDRTMIGTSTLSNFTDNTVSEGVSYRYTVSAYDATGNESNQSDPARISTPIRPVTITSFNVTQLGNDTATISWTTNIATRSIVNFGSTQSRSDSQTSNSDLLTDHSMTFSGLQSNTNYYYTINADSGYTIDKAWGNFRTLPPSVMALVPTGLTAVAADSNTIDLSWNDPIDPTGVIAGYQIYRGDEVIGTCSVSNYTDSTVIEGESYQYKVYAYDAIGNVSPRSNPVRVKTPIRPVTITSYNVTQLGSDTATINWTTNIATRSIVNFGSTHSRSDSQTDTSDLLTDHSMTFTGLQSNTNYYYTINADSGYTIDKAWGNFRTPPSQ